MLKKTYIYIISFLLIGFSFNSSAEKRVAFIIGNSEYISDGYNYLSQPINDAEAVDKALKSFGFETILVKNATHNQMIDSLLKFTTILEGADAAVFYYSGHGNSINHQEYIVPANTKFRSVALESQFLSLESIQREMIKRSKLSIIFYDACRNNPNAEISIISQTKGFIDTYKRQNNIMVCYATKQGETAVAGTSTLSPFTEILLDNIYKKEDFKTLWHNHIVSDSRLKQRPQNTGGYSNTFYFNRPSSFETNESLVNTFSIENLNIEQLETLAEKGDSRAYIPASEFYLKNAFGFQDYEKAYSYALKAWNSNIEIENAREIFKKLESLGFFYIYRYNNPINK